MWIFTEFKVAGSYYNGGIFCSKQSLFFFCMSRLYSQGARFLCNNGQLEKSSKLCGQQHKNVRYEM